MTETFETAENSWIYRLDLGKSNAMEMTFLIEQIFIDGKRQNEPLLQMQ